MRPVVCHHVEVVLGDVLNTHFQRVRCIDGPGDRRGILPFVEVHPILDIKEVQGASGMEKSLGQWARR